MTNIGIGFKTAEGFKRTGGVVDAEALSGAYVRFEDQNGNPLPNRNVVIKVDSATGEILDIVSEA